MKSRAEHEIENDVQRLLVHINGSLDPDEIDWDALANRAERLVELARNGKHYQHVRQTTEAPAASAGGKQQ